MNYDREDYMRRQDAEHDMIRMRDPSKSVFAYRNSATAPLTFILAPGEEVEPGDLVMIDRATGKVRKFVVGVDQGQAFTVPPGSRVTANGHLEMPR